MGRRRAVDRLRTRLAPVRLRTRSPAVDPGQQFVDHLGGHPLVLGVGRDTSRARIARSR